MEVRRAKLGYSTFLEILPHFSTVVQCTILQQKNAEMLKAVASEGHNQFAKLIAYFV